LTAAAAELDRVNYGFGEAVAHLFIGKIESILLISSSSRHHQKHHSIFPLG